MAKAKNVRVLDEEGAIVGIDLVANDIQKLQDSMTRIESSRISRKLLLAILYDDTKLSKNTIALVLDSLISIEKRYLKPKSLSGSRRD